MFIINCGLCGETVSYLNDHRQQFYLIINKNRQQKRTFATDMYALCIGNRNRELHSVRSMATHQFDKYTQYGKNGTTDEKKNYE